MVVVVLVDIQNMELVLTNIFTLCWQYIPRHLVNLVVSHLEEQLPAKKGVLTYQFFFSCFGRTPQDPTKKVFDLIIGIFSHPPRARSIDPGHFVGNCFWLGTDFCRTS